MAHCAALNRRGQHSQFERAVDHGGAEGDTASWKDNRLRRYLCIRRLKCVPRVLAGRRVQARPGLPTGKLREGNDTSSRWGFASCCKLRTENLAEAFNPPERVVIIVD